MKNHINPTEIACAIPSLEKLLYIKESQRLCQSVVNLAMHLSDDQCMKTSIITLSLPCLHGEMMEPGRGPLLDYDQYWSVVQGSQTRHESPWSINKTAVSPYCLTELLTHNTSTCDH